MEYLGETIVVLLILVGVAVAAVAFEPADPLDNWNRLIERYGTSSWPKNPQFTAQQVAFGGPRGALKPLGPDAVFDAELDDFGLCLAGRGIGSGDTPNIIRVPGTHVRPAGKRKQGFVFKLYAEPPVRILVAGELGSEMLRKSGQDPG
jgi:hypothetical protein